MNVYHGVYTIGLSDDRWSSVPPARGALDLRLLPPCWRARAPGTLVGRVPELCFDRPLEHSGGRHGLSGVPVSGLNLSSLTGQVWSGLCGDTLCFFLSLCSN